MSDRTETPLPEALRQVERVLRSREHRSGATMNECADVVARAREELEYRVGTIGDLLAEAGEVAVPIAELEALRDWIAMSRQFTGVPPFRTVTDPLIARIPAPPWEPPEAMADAMVERTHLTYADAEAALRALHDAGLLREDSDHE